MAANILGIAMLLNSVVYGKVFRDHQEIQDTIHFVINGLFMLPMSLEVEDTIYRQRFLAMYAVFWRIHLPCFCRRTSHIVVAATIMSVAEILANMYAFRMAGMEMPMRLPFVLLIISAWAFKAGSSLQAQCIAYADVTQELADAKAAQRSLISMLCDGCVELAVDGDTLIHSSSQFDSLMKQQVKGTSLKSYIPSDESEQLRLAGALAQARKVGPVALPVTLLTKEKARHQADLFIVRRREIDTSGANHAGFLIGIRSDQQSSEISNDDLAFLQPYTKGQDVVSESEASFALAKNEDASFAKYRPEEPSLAKLPSLVTSNYGAYQRVQEQGDEDASSNACSYAARSVPAELHSDLCRLREHDVALASSPCVQNGGDCLPAEGTVWVENCALPKAIRKLEPDDKILCYDNLTRGLVYTPVLTASPASDAASNEWVTVTLGCGAVLDLTADHPVAVQSACSNTKGSSPLNRRCVRACDLQADRDSLMMLNICPREVARVEHKSKDEFSGDALAVADDTTVPNKWMTVTVAQPQRHELLVASQSQSTCIAVSSCDRMPDSVTHIHVKNTFIVGSTNDTRKLQRSSSAPSGLSRMDWPPLEPIVTFTPTVTDASSTSGTSQSNSESHSLDHIIFKVGHSMPGEEANTCSIGRLSDMLNLKVLGVHSIGSLHARKNQCTPCSFYFTHIRNPTRRPSCKASYMCEYCHDLSHFDNWRSKLRKCRPSRLS